MRKRITHYLGTIIVVSMALAGCGRGVSEAGKNDVIPVKVMKVELKDMNKTLEYAGNIKGVNEAIIYPRVTGKVLEKVKEEGAVIMENEPILYINRDEVGLEFKKAPVESPIAGVLGRIYVDIGSSVSPQTPVAMVTDTAKVEINLDVPEKYLPKIAIGDNAEIRVDAWPEEVFRGMIVEISPVVDIGTRTAPVKIHIDNAGSRLKSGMFAKVKLNLGTRKNVPVITKEAIIGKEPEAYVYVVEKNKAVIRKVSLGIHEGADFEITSGLREGDRVVVMGQQKLYEGAFVECEE